MRTIQSIEEMRIFSRKMHEHGASVALVPTMGALHEGHFSLLRHAKAKCQVTVASIFVNPTQFGPGEDFEKYPRRLNEDLRALEALGVDAVFAPTPAEIYPPGFATAVDPGPLATILEGAIRPGHFKGVATVVLKLLNIVQPDVACFGQKDFQQVVIIRILVEDLNLRVQLEVLPTVREPDGLAKSSRNAYLSAKERQASLALPRALRRAQELWWEGERSAARVVNAIEQILNAVPQLTPEYAAIRHAGRLEPTERIEPGCVALAAVRMGSTRLIDNIIFGPREASERDLVELAFYPQEIRLL
jgi:pantoate--beta-alanine ligase